MVRPAPKNSDRSPVPVQAKREAAFNAPLVVVVLIALFILVHLVRSFLSEAADVEILLRFAFIPARYDALSEYAPDFRGGLAADVWSFVTYAFLHGDWLHLAVNALTMLAFGSALAWRFGAARFLLFSALTAAAGAATHLAFHYGAPIPVIGASAAISGHLAAAMRFVFAAGRPFDAYRAVGPEAFQRPAEPISVTIRRRPVIVGVCAWFAMNLLFGLGGVAMMGVDAAIAWEAHMGGFVAGFLLFPLLDPIRARWTPPHPEDAWEEPLRGPADPPHDGGTGAAGPPVRNS